jgi:hypothetical protein
MSLHNINQRTGPTFTAPDGRVTATGASIDVIADPTFGKIYRVTRANFNSARARRRNTSPSSRRTRGGSIA